MDFSNLIVSGVILDFFAFNTARSVLALLNKSRGKDTNIIQLKDVLDHTDSTIKDHKTFCTEQRLIEMHQ